MDQVDRIHSGQHFNDQSVYHSDEYNDDDSSFENTGKPDTIQEVRDGIVNERDVDLERGQSQHPELEKSRTAKSNRSRHDPKLVSYCGPSSLSSKLRSAGYMGW